jgi:3-oxoacyl-[acyl-carrier-protein] synthase-1
VSAQIAAWRLLQSGKYNTAIVIGCDVQSQFIVSGFQSFKALSDSPCRPFDAERTGLNLGEAVATMIYSSERPKKSCWQLIAGSMHNDANHISGPSRTGEGSYRCLVDVLQNCNTADINALSVHGTATPYNDEMEAIAIHRAHMQEVPILAFKGYYGHTMGAAGVLETILTMLALENGTLIGNPRYDACGTSYALNITKEHRSLGKLPMYFIKMMSGFGGCNAAIRLSYCGCDEL